MESLKIQYELKKRGIDQKQIAADNDVSPMAVSKVINKSMVSDRLMKAVSELIGEDHRLVIGEYYLRPPLRNTSKVS